MLGENGLSYAVPTVGLGVVVGGFSLFPPTEITAVPKFPFLRFARFWKANFAKRRFRRVTLWSEIGYSEGARRLADFSLIPARRNYERFRISHLCDLCDFWKLIARFATPDESHFGQKLPFWRVSAGGRISVESHFIRVAFWSNAAILMGRRRLGDFGLICARRNCERF